VPLSIEKKGEKKIKKKKKRKEKERALNTSSTIKSLIQYSLILYDMNNNSYIS